MMRTSPRGIALITEFEGFRAAAYQDVVGVWTIGYGFTRGVQPGDKMTKAQANQRLSDELLDYERAVAEAAGQCNQNQFDALTCFTWNVGIAGMKKSSVIKAHVRGDYTAAARAFALWNKAGGRVWPGLTRRRAAEAALYLEPMPDAITEPMPQAVEPERPMTASTINRAGAIAGGTAAVATVAESVSAVNSLKRGVDDLGAWLVPALLIVVVALCGYIVWERIKQRRGGWA
jgi:lysozyme